MYQLGSAILRPFGLRVDRRGVITPKENRERLKRAKQEEAEIQRQLREFDIQMDRLALNYSKHLYNDKELEAKGISRSNLKAHVREMPEFEEWVLRCYQGKGSYEEMYWYHKQLTCTCPSISRQYVCESCPYSRMR